MTDEISNQGRSVLAWATGEKSSSQPKTPMFPKPNHGQLQRLSVASVMGENCPAHTRPDTQMVYCHPWGIAVKEYDPSGWSGTSQESNPGSVDFIQVFIQDLLLPFPFQAPLSRPPYGARERKTFSIP